MPNESKTVVCRLIEEVVNGGKTELLAELVAADHVGHDPLGDHYGPEGLRIAVAEYQAAFRDFRVIVDDWVTEGDKVVHRFWFQGTHSGPFLGIPPTGRVVRAAGIVIARVVDGKVAESWVSLDALNLLRQLGARPVLRRHAERMPPETVPPYSEEMDLSSAT
jgi:steroid delta-isomerase-like uncharacterized protein